MIPQQVHELLAHHSGGAQDFPHTILGYSLFADSLLTILA